MRIFNLPGGDIPVMTVKFNYTKLQNKADTLLQKFGYDETEAYIARLTSDPGAVLSFDEKPANLINYTVSLVKVPLSRTDRDSLIQAGYTKIDNFLKILISGKSITEMKINDYIIATEQYKVITLKTIKPYTTSILHSCLCEKNMETGIVKVIVQEDGLIITQEDGKAIGVII
jgi:hypothetical protein